MSGRYIAIQGAVRLDDPGHLAIESRKGGLLSREWPIIAVDPDPGRPVSAG
jgi:hypothetical protein